MIIEEQANRLVEPHFGRRSLLAVETLPPDLAGDGGERAVLIDLADHTGPVAEDEQVPLSIEVDARWFIQSGLGGRASVPGVALLLDPDRVDDAVFVDLADPVVVIIGDVEVSFAVERNVGGGQLRLGSRATVAREVATPVRRRMVIVPEGSIIRTLKVSATRRFPRSSKAERIGELGGGGRLSIAGIATPRLCPRWW